MSVKALPGRSYMVDQIGEMAMVELMAEEATELAFACIKLARFLRGENPVFARSEDELVAAVHEELADVQVNLRAMVDSGMVDESRIAQIVRDKNERIRKRFGHPAPDVKAKRDDARPSIPALDYDDETLERLREIAPGFGEFPKSCF